MSSLLAPFTLRSGAVLRNRVALAPLTNTQSHDDGRLGDDELRWLARRARGGFALVETCAAFVSPDGKGFDGQLGVASDAEIPRLGELARALRDAGALGVVQLYHGGARSPSRLTGRQPWSASAFEEDRPGFERPRAATEAEVEAARDRFVEAAVRCEAAGFGGVELHAAHGYLLGQFLSRTQNVREDRWGGDLEGRARLLREIARGVRARTAPGFALGVRLSPEDFGLARGMDLDESLQTARWLADDGVDWIHVSLWDATRATQKRPGEHPAPLFRAAVAREVALVAAGKVWTRADAEALLALGVDVVALGRAAIVEPEWPLRIAEPAWSPRRPPLTEQELAERDVSPRFVTYLRRFDGMVR